MGVLASLLKGVIFERRIARLRCEVSQPRIVLDEGSQDVVHGRLNEGASVAQIFHVAPIVHIVFVKERVALAIEDERAHAEALT